MKMINGHQNKSKISQKEFHDKTLHRAKTKVFYSENIRKVVDSYLYKILGDLKDKVVLDYGCGVGELSIKILLRNAKTIAIDISIKRIEKSIENIKYRKIDTFPKFIKMDCEKLAFKDNSFDFIVGRGILHHLNLMTSIKEIYRVLKPGGKAFFIEPLGMNPIINIYRYLTPNERVQDEKPLSFKDIKAIGSVFKNHDHKEFYFLSFFAFAVKILFKSEKLFIKTLEYFYRLDSILITIFPFVRSLYWQTVISLEK